MAIEIKLKFFIHHDNKHELKKWMENLDSSCKS